MNNAVELPRQGHYSAHNSFKAINFYCSAPTARAVQLVGDFNHWDPTVMERRDGGWWFIQLWLPHGHHQYRFLVDGSPTLDLHAVGSARDGQGNLVSLVAVS
ncbi:MAG TPA: glycoside hydrolase family 13 [Verrucomicrobiae bacterium]|nr:glycoside hydrolase family 13 [Verrucomicrobiae bacterium]